MKEPPEKKIDEIPSPQNKSVYLQDRLKGLVEELEIDLNKKDKQLRDYKKGVPNMEEEINELKSQLKFSEAVIDHQYSRIEEIEKYEKRMNTLEKERAEKENLLFDLRSQIDSLSSVNSALEKERSEKEEKIRKLEEIVSAKEDQLSKFRKKNRVIETKVGKLKEAVEPLIEKKEGLTQRFPKHDKDGELSLEDELDFLIDNISERANKFSYYKGIVDNMEAKLNEFKADVLMKLEGILKGD